MATSRLTLRLLACALPFASLACEDDDSGPDTSWGEAFDAFDPGWFLHVWGPSADNLFAVGGEPGTGVAMNYDGSSWSSVDLGVEVPLLNWTWGAAADDIRIVGEGGTVIHWDGSSWTLEETPTDQNLWGIWGSGPDNIYAVGGEGREEGQDTIIHYDGTSWTAVETPPLQRPGVNAFFKVWGTGPDNVIVVGQRGAVLRYDGTDWNEELVGTGEDLIAVWGTGPDRIALVGGRGNGQVVTWNGVEWQRAQLSPTPGINGVWMRNDDVIHFAAERGTLGTIDFDTREVTSEHFEPTDLDFHALYGDESGTLTAVGGNFLNFTTGPYNGIALERNLSGTE